MKHLQKSIKKIIVFSIIIINISIFTTTPKTNAKYYKDVNDNDKIGLTSYKYTYQSYTYEYNDIDIIYKTDGIYYNFTFDRNTAIYSENDNDTYNIVVNNLSGDYCTISNIDSSVTPSDEYNKISNKLIYNDNKPDKIKLTIKCSIPNTMGKKFNIKITEQTGNEKQNAIITFLKTQYDVAINVDKYNSIILDTAIKKLYEDLAFVKNLDPTVSNPTIQEQIETYLKNILKSNSETSNIGVTISYDSNNNIEFSFDSKFIGYALTATNNITSTTNTEYQLFISNLNENNNQNYEIIENHLKNYGYTTEQITKIIDGIKEVGGLDTLFKSSITTAYKSFDIGENEISIKALDDEKNVLRMRIPYPFVVSSTSRARRSISKNVEINNYTIDNDTNIDSELSDKVITDENVQDLIKNGNENKLPDFIDYTTIVDDKKIVLVIVYNATTDDEVSTFVKIIDFDSIEDSDILYLPINPTNNEFENLLKITNEDGSSVTYELLPAIDGDTEEYIYEENDNNIKCYKYSINKISE